jgi:hypothetical protein
MQHKKNLFSIFVFSSFLFTSFSLEIKKNDTRFFIATGNDKISNSLSQNNDDWLTATTGIKVILPYFFADLAINSITNRGYKTDLSNPETFKSGRYDELILKTGTNLNLFSISNFTIDFTPQTGFCLLANFGMEKAQNLNHRLCKVNKIELNYENFSKPFVPLINLQIDCSWKPYSFIKLNLSVDSNNSIFYITEQNFYLNTLFGTKTQFNVFAGYTLKQTHNDSTTLMAYKNASTGFNYGFMLDTGLIKIDYISYAKTRFGLGTINIDLMALTKRNWERTDLNYFTGLCYIINTEFLENQIQSNPINNFSFYFNNKYVSGFKKNEVNPSDYRYERNYIINSVGIKYEQPFKFTKNWVTPYVELGTGIAIFGLQKLANQIPDSNFNSFKYKTKSLWHLEANLGLDIFPQGLFNFGNATYSFTFYAGTIFIPNYKEAGEQIKQDTYRTTDWELKPFEFKIGFALHMGLDF